MNKIPDNNHVTEQKILDCKAEEYFGQKDFLLCLEDSPRGKECLYRVSLGSRHFCTSSRRISHFRNYGKP